MCKQWEDIWRQRSRNAQTMKKKEAVIINCSEMRTEGTSRPSVGMFPACLLRTWLISNFDIYFDMYFDIKAWPAGATFVVCSRHVLYGMCIIMCTHYIRYVYYDCAKESASAQKGKTA